MVCNEENGIFDFKTDSKIGLGAGEHCLRYVEGGHQGHQIAFSDF